MTTIMRYDPFREALSLRNALDQLFEQSFVRPTWGMNGMQGDARMLPQEAVGDGWHEAGGHRFGTTNVQLPDRRIAQEFDLSDALPQFIENRNAALDQRLAVQGRLDSLGLSVEQPYAERLFQIRNRL